jgi:hypothetical protein
VLVGIQDEGKRRMIGSAYAALRKIGARNPLNAAFRGSFALVGYTGPGRPAFVRQVTHQIF